MSAITRAIIRLSALLAPRADRARFKEEWLGEVRVVATRGSGRALRFALGAPRDAWSMRAPMRLLTAIGGDLKYAARQLIHRPSHTLAVVACLTVGLVVSVGTFSVIASLFHGDQPGIHDRRSLARVYLGYDSANNVENVGGQRVPAEPLSLNDFAVIRQLNPDSAFAFLGGEAALTLTVTGDHGPLATTAAFASGDFFRVLGTEPGAAGRLLNDNDDQPGAPPVALVADHFWRTELDARPDAIGRQILVAGVSFTVVGVAPPRFHGMQILDIGSDDSKGVQIWVPLVHAASWPSKPSPDNPWITVVGRMREGRTAADARNELTVPAARIAAAAPSMRANAAPVVRPHGFGPDNAPMEVLLVIALVMALPLTVLGIGCANVANLQLARVAERSRELAVRLSLGATRAQLIRLLTIETLGRSLTAVALALAIILVLMRYFQPYFPVSLVIDWTVALFATTLALAVALGTGLMPAWLVLRKTATGQLKQSAQSGGPGHSRTRATLIVVQVALSLGLLTMTALVVRTIDGMATSAPPALGEQMLASFNPSELGLNAAEARQFADTLASRAAADGRVRGVAVSINDSVRFGTSEMALSTYPLAALVGMTPSWIDVMDVQVLAGRRLTATDDASVAMISERAAEIIAPGGSPLGLMINIGGPQPDAEGGGRVVRRAESVGTLRQVRVVGVLADNPTRPDAARPGPVIYTTLPSELTGEFLLRVRIRACAAEARPCPGEGAVPEAVGQDLMKLVTAVDPRITWTYMRRGDMRFQDEAKEMVNLALAVGACGTIALILSATGLYAVMSYVVMLRRREIGVRLAIGAAPGRIVALVMRQAVTLVSIGAGVGLALSIPLAFVMRATFVAKVNATDPMVYAPALTLLFVVGAIAAAVPALRASRVDPITTLRQD